MTVFPETPAMPILAENADISNPRRYQMYFPTRPHKNFFGDDDDYTVFRTFGPTRRNLLNDFDYSEPRGRDFEDEKEDIE